VSSAGQSFGCSQLSGVQLTATQTLALIQVFVGGADPILDLFFICTGGRAMIDTELGKTFTGNTLLKPRLPAAAKQSHCH